MGAYKSDYIKNKERRKQLERYRYRRTQVERPTSRQIDYLILLGHKKQWQALATLDWVKAVFVLEHCHNDVSCFMDLNKEEVSQAINRLKEELARE